MQRKTKSRPKIPKVEPEEISGLRKLASSAASIAEREKLAETVKKLVDEAFSPCLKKLTELRPMITELRQHFMKLKSGKRSPDVGPGRNTARRYCAAATGEFAR
jgi:hypothetical protein